MREGRGIGEVTNIVKFGNRVQPKTKARLEAYKFRPIGSTETNVSALERTEALPLQTNPTSQGKRRLLRTFEGERGRGEAGARGQPVRVLLARVLVPHQRAQSGQLTQHLHGLGVLVWDRCRAR